MIYPEDYIFLHEIDKPRKIELGDISSIMYFVGIIAVLIWGFCKIGRLIWM